MAQAAREAINLLIYSADAQTRQQVRDAIGTRLSSDLPPVKWIEAATATIAQDLVHNQNFDALVLDGETTKIAGTVLARTLLNEEEQVPPMIMLVARPQDEWLAQWSGAVEVVTQPLDPFKLESALLKVLAA